MAGDSARFARLSDREWVDQNCHRSIRMAAAFGRAPCRLDIDEAGFLGLPWMGCLNLVAFRVGIPSFYLASRRPVALHGWVRADWKRVHRSLKGWTGFRGRPDASDVRAASLPSVSRRIRPPEGLGRRRRGTGMPAPVALSMDRETI